MHAGERRKGAAVRHGYTVTPGYTVGTSPSELEACRGISDPGEANIAGKPSLRAGGGGRG